MNDRCPYCNHEFKAGETFGQTGVPVALGKEVRPGYAHGRQLEPGEVVHIGGVPYEHLGGGLVGTNTPNARDRGDELHVRVETPGLKR